MPGVYTYMAHVFFGNEQKIVKTGTITLVR